MRSKNLFRIRTAEHFDENAHFLRLFGPLALDFFEPGEMWQKIQIIRSARGGGKTSILRIFSPESLLEISSRSQNGAIAPLYNKLRGLGVFGSDGSVRVMGVLMSMLSNYPVLERLGLDRGRRDMMFYTMVASKMTVATLRSVCRLKSLEFPGGLEDVRIGRPAAPVPEAFPVACSGLEMYNWASESERSIHDSLEGGAGQVCHPWRSGHETLAILHALQSGNILHRGRPVAHRTLLMLDDVDKLTAAQRSGLFRALADLRVPGVWVAERLEALQNDELLAPNGTLGREYGKPVMLERFWRKSPARFARLLREIADKREASFAGNLPDALDRDPDSHAARTLCGIGDAVRSRFGDREKYKGWFRAVQGRPAPLDDAIEWTSLRLLIERDRNNAQKTIVDSEPLPADGIPDALQSLRSTSKYLVCAENRLPYCYGFGDLAALSSSNIQQFLGLAGSLLDEMMTARTLGLDAAISPARQYEILCGAADERWDEIVKTVHCDGLVTFLENMAKFCMEQTTLAGSPYRAVTGIAISAANQERLRRRSVGENPRYDAVANVLSTGFAHNILEPNPDVSQGARGSKHLVIYLNRLLCLKYRLPLAYGGWREMTLESVSRLLDAVHPDAAAVPIPRALEVAAR